MQQKKEREPPDAYPSLRYDQVTFAWTSTAKPTLQKERELTATRSHAFEFGRFKGREQEQFAQVYFKVSDGFSITFRS